MNQDDRRDVESAQENERSDSLAGDADAADKNLLFGILDVQMNFISQQSLITGINAWVLDERRLLRDVLIKLQLMQPKHGDIELSNVVSY